MFVGENFGVTTNGIACATNAEIEGTITANFGNIGGWLVDWLDEDNTTLGKGLYKRTTENEEGISYTTGMAAHSDDS
jgi:hypothetical protein